MKYFVVSMLFLLMSASLAAEDSGLLRFVCQKYYFSNGRPSDKVAIVEQLSTRRIDSDGVEIESEIIDGSDLINSNGKTYSGQTAFRMRIFSGVSLLSNDKTKEEVIEELLEQEASRDIKGRLMDFKGKGGRLRSTFGFETKLPYDKGLLVDLKDLDNGTMDTNNAASTMFEDGLYRCEEPVLIPVE